MSGSPKKPLENRGVTGVPPVAGRFRRGQSGNPGGRPKGLRSLIQRVVGHDGEKLVEFWALVAFADDAEVQRRLGTDQAPRWQDRMAALEELANRGFGRPAPSLDQESSGVGIVVTWQGAGDDDGDDGDGDE